jgi:hypothetical protein
LIKGTKLGSVNIDGKGHKGDLGFESEVISTYTHPAPFQPPITPPIHPNTTNLPKTSTLFSDTPNPTSVWLYKAISQLEITANSTCRREVNPKNGLAVLYDSLQKITL